jgi:hypothetical protein
VSPRVEKDPFNLRSKIHSAYELKEAERIIENLRVHNANLKTFKGIGNIKIWDKNESFLFRSAWVGDAPQKIRIEFLGPHGQPVISLATDGDFIYYFSHVENRFYKKAIKKEGKAPFIKIPVELDKIIDLIVGRIPTGDYSYLKLEENPPEKGYILFLLFDKTDSVEKIFLDKDKKNVSMMECYRPDGTLLYRVTYNKNRQIGNYMVPFSLAIFDNDGTGFQLDVDRFWADTKVNPSVFVLPHPG